MADEQRQAPGADPDALAQQAGRLAERVTLLGEYLDPPAIEARVAELEVEMGAGDFWDDQARAAKVSAEHSPRAAKAGAVVIDNTSYWRMDPDVPLVVPTDKPKIDAM